MSAIAFPFHFPSKWHPENSCDIYNQQKSDILEDVYFFFSFWVNHGVVFFSPRIFCDFWVKYWEPALGFWVGGTLTNMKWVTASYLWMRCYFSAEITPSYVENGVRPLQCSTQCIFSQQVKYFFFLTVRLSWLECSCSNFTGTVQLHDSCA